MTEFDKFWDRHELPVEKAVAEEIWHAAQRAVIRTISNPPHLPQPGENILFLSLCHPNSMNVSKKVVEINKGVIDCYWICTEDKNGNTSTGILGEVINEDSGNS